MMEKFSNNFIYSKKYVVGFSIVLLSLKACLCDRDNICDRRPFNTNTESLPPDNRFEIDIDSISADYKYIPHRKYTVRLFSMDKNTAFMGFSIWLREDEMYNEKNPRRPRQLDPGKLYPAPNSETGKSHPHCNNTVIQNDITPKTFVEALWIAPGKGNLCVTIYATVALKPDVWYTNEGPLSKRLCEDDRDADDILPMQNDNCTVCEEARYQLTFSGKWSYNTHSQMFPLARELARFSDVVGASHSKYFSVYKYNAEASGGIKMLAEQGNTTELELEIQKELGQAVRTVIKATAPAATDMTTVTSFRVNSEKHLVSLATGIMPSPDWFLGVANLELCRETQDKRSEWAPTVSLNLYPYDAGTDSGKTFESSNEITSPFQPIASAAIIEDFPNGKKKAFARVRFDLIRTYPNPECTTENPVLGSKGEEDGGEENGNEEEYNPPDENLPEPETTPKSAEPEIVETESGSCPMTAWEEWPCDGPCEEGTRTGYRMKYRYHLVNGVAIGKYSSGSSANKMKQVPQHCWTQDTSQMEECTEECTEEKVNDKDKTEANEENPE